MAKIKFGDKLVLESGTIITYDDRPISIFFGTNPELNLDIHFVVTEDKALKMTAESIEPNKLKITIKNFDHELGAGSLNPIPIGDINGKFLYFSWRAYSLVNSVQKTFHYTIYIDE